MATRTNKVEVEITAIDEASPKIDKLTAKIDGLEADEARIRVTADISKMDAQLTDALALVQQLEGDELTVHMRAVGTLEDDLIAARKLLEQLDGQTGTVKLTADTSDLDAGAHRAKTGIDEIGKSADSSKSVLANMIGNSAQDLGDLGGIAGSAGVAIGQIGEYAADATLAGERLGSALSSMAMVAGPIAALAVGTQLLSMWMNRGKEDAKAIAEATDEYADALFRAQDANESLQGSIEKTAQSQVDKFIKELGDDTDEFGESLDDLGISYDDLIRAFAHGDGPLVNAKRRYADLQDEIRTATRGGLVPWIEAQRRVAESHGMTAESFQALIDDLAVVNEATGKNVDISNKAIANAEAAAAIREREATATGMTAEALALLNDQQDRYVEGLIARHDEAEQQERTNAQLEAARDKLTRLNVEAERVDRARIVAQERAEVEELRDTYSRLRSDLSDRKSLLQLQADFDTLRDKGVEAWTKTVEGAEDAEQAQRDYQIEQLNTLDNALAYLDTLNQFPAKVTTDIEALIDQGKYSEALTKIEILTAPRTIELQAHLDELAIQEQIRRAYRNAGITYPGGGPRSLPPDTSGGGGGGAPVVVNLNMPVGSRGIDVLRQVSGQARRSGRKYGVPVVHYARRAG